MAVAEVRRPALSHALVAAQLLGVLGCVYPIDLLGRGHALLLVICAAGMALGGATLWFNRIGNFSIYPEVKARAALVTTGPYRWVRHPMYVALVVMMLGIALFNRHPDNLSALILVAAVVVAKSLLEERYLAARFPEYAAYRARTARFIPLLW